MQLKLFKFLVQPVLLEVGDEDVPVGERVGDPVAFYSVEQFVAFAEDLKQKLEEANNSSAVPKEE